MRHRLELLAGEQVEVTWHENRSVFLSVKRTHRRIALRLHRLFYDAPTPVLEAIVAYALRRDKSARPLIRQMAHLHFSRTRATPKPLSSVGIVYDLQPILDRMRALLPIEGLCIGWGQQRSTRLRSITFATYHQHTQQIRINPILDNADVPLYFLEFIVYHEMLHALCPSKMDGRGRCSVHTAEFREKERLFPRFHEAKEWEKGWQSFFRKRKHYGRA